MTLGVTASAYQTNKGLQHNSIPGQTITHQGALGKKWNINILWQLSCLVTPYSFLLPPIVECICLFFLQPVGVWKKIGSHLFWYSRLWLQLVPTLAYWNMVLVLFRWSKSKTWSVLTCCLTSYSTLVLTLHCQKCDNINYRGSDGDIKAPAKCLSSSNKDSFNPSDPVSI